MKEYKNYKMRMLAIALIAGTIGRLTAMTYVTVVDFITPKEIGFGIFCVIALFMLGFFAGHEAAINRTEK